ncbi:MAG TPA: hypothetical protein VM096_07500 [Vicinamibacterales bacterium]|nr:hypothetical protein [Vicinamibacterales bacterium]
MNRCAVCKRRVFFASRTANGAAFCSNYCFTYSEMPGFCGECSAATTDASPGDSVIGGWFATILVGFADRCATCHSIVQRKRVLILGIPVSRSARYRVIYTNHTTYVGRQLKERH